VTLVSWAVVVQHLADDPKQPGSALGLCHSGYGNWLPKITLMVTTERWTNGVLTSILLRVGSSGGGLPSALQVFGFAGRRYLYHLHRCESPRRSRHIPCRFWYFPQHGNGCETFSTSAHLIHSKRIFGVSRLRVARC